MNEPPSRWLPAVEVEELTGRKQHAAQCRTLARMGIPFRPNGVGRPLVEVEAVKVKRGKAA